MFKIPKKYEDAIREVYKDEDGVWCMLNKGYTHGTDQNEVIHCESFTELRSELKYIEGAKK